MQDFNNRGNCVLGVEGQGWDGYVGLGLPAQFLSKSKIIPSK